MNMAMKPTKGLVMEQARILSATLAMLLFLCPLPARAQAWSGIITPPRAIDWTHAGVIGGIPSTWTQCGPTIAAFGSVGTPAAPTVIINAMNHTGAGYTGCSTNTYVQLGVGTFYLNAGIKNKGVNNTEIRGMGASQTILNFSSGTTCQAGNTTCLISFEDNNGEYAGGSPAATSWTAGYSQGATSITVASGSNITANTTILVLDQCETGFSGAPCSGTATDNGNFFDCETAYNPTGPVGCSYNAGNGNAARPHRFQEEFVLVTACSPSCGSAGSTVLTITPPLQNPNWASGQTPQVWLSQANKFVGVQNLTVNAAGTTAGQAIGFNNISNFWVHGVAVLHAFSQGIGLYLVDQGEISSNYIFDSGQGSTASDPSGIDYNGSNVLIANNIIQSQRLSTVANGPSSGNVIAYNFMINCYEGVGFMFGCLWDGHSNGNNFNLFEGNVVNQVFEDQTHGGKLAQTYYRNFLTGWESCANGNCGTDTAKNAGLEAAAPLSFNRYGNWIANVMGTPGGPSSHGYSISDPSGGNGLGGTTGYIWQLGSGNACSPGTGCIGGPIPVDSVVGTTIMRWGNWDVVSNATRWCGNSSNTGWVATCSSTSEIPSGIGVFPNSIPTKGDTGGALPASFYYSSRPSWWSALIPFPAIGPDVLSGNVGVCSGVLNTVGHYSGVAAISGVQCTGTSLTTAWAGHVNAIPAMACALNVMGMPPDGTGPVQAFSAQLCYSGSTLAPPTNLKVVPLNKPGD